MEHDDRPPVATFYVDASLDVGSVVSLGEGQAHHARVKRLESGDVVRLTDGSGRLVIGEIAGLTKSTLLVSVRREAVAPKRPALHVRVPIGDRERMLWLAEKATELGISSWQSVRFRRSASVSPRGEGAAFAEKIRARMLSALEQSGGAWLPQLLPETTPDSIDVAGANLRILLAIDGDPLTSTLALDCARVPVIVFGPEGGIDADESAALRAAGWIATRVAPTTLRFETAGLAAIAVVRAAHMLEEG